MKLAEPNIISKNNPYKIIAVDDDNGILDSLSVFLKHSGYNLTTCTNPMEAIEMVKAEHFDLMLLDFIMTPIHGDEVVEEIRKFNQELYIILITSHKDLAPPLETIKRLSIQGYWDKNNKFDQLLLLIESAIKSIKQMKLIQEINFDLQKSQENLEKSYLDCIEILRQTVEAKDTYTRGHSDRVSEYSVLIGKYMGLSADELYHLKIGGLFHDIGKIGIPDSILLKEAKLTDEEYAQIKHHPLIGKNILSNASIFEDIIPIVYHHHEKFDGTGYPSGLAGENIPLLARIAAVADTFDSMSSKRSYRDFISIETIKDEFKKCSGSQFDPKIASLFVDILNHEYHEIEKIQNKYKS